MIDAVKSHQSDNDQINSDDIVQKPRQDQDQDAGDKGNERRNMGGSNDHGFSSVGKHSMGLKGQRRMLSSRRPAARERTTSHSVLACSRKLGTATYGPAIEGESPEAKGARRRGRPLDTFFPTGRLGDGSAEKADSGVAPQNHRLDRRARQDQERIGIPKRGVILYPPSIREKSATARVAVRISLRSLSRFSRSAPSLTLTVTLSKKASTCGRSFAMARMAASKSSARTARVASALAPSIVSASALSSACR